MNVETFRRLVGCQLLTLDYIGARGCACCTSRYLWIRSFDSWEALASIIQSWIHIVTMVTLLLSKCWIPRVRANHHFTLAFVIAICCTLRFAFIYGLRAFRSHHRRVHWREIRLHALLLDAPFGVLNYQKWSEVTKKESALASLFVTASILD